MDFPEFLHNILFVIVLYKKKWADSSLCILFNNHTLFRHVSIFVYDNSTEAQTITRANILYQHDPFNSGVSKAYNEAAKVASQTSKRWMLFLDQDTTIDIDYLKKLFDSTIRHKVSVAFVPKLYDHKGMVSPFRWHFGKGKRVAVNESTLSLHNYRFANSGLLIRCDAFEGVKGYDEKIPLDFSDIAFGEKLKKITDHFVVVNALVKHSFSGSEKNIREEALKRFGYFCTGAFVMANETGPFYMYAARAFLRGIKLSLSYKNFTFIKIFLQHLKHG